MTSVERVMTALERRVPDRVPFAEFYIGGKYLSRHFAGYSYAEFIERHGLDVVLVPPGRSALKKHGRDTWVDNWNIVYKDTGEDSLIEYICPITRKRDLISYKPPNPDEDPRLEQLREIVARFKHRKAIVFPVSDAFSRPRTLVGMEKLLLSFIDNPEFVDLLVEMSLAYYLRLLERAIAIGADIIISADDYAGNAGPLMAPHHFQRFILPGLTRLVQRCHEFGAKYVKHTDGNINPLLDMLIAAGIDGLHPIEECSGMSIAKVKKEYGAKVCVIGSIDCRELLSYGTAQEVSAGVKRQISQLAPGGGYMLASSNSIHSGVPAENFIAMAQAVNEFGRYPIAV